MSIIGRLSAFLVELELEPTVKRSDFIEHVGARILTVRWREQRGKAPRPTASLDDQDAAFLGLFLTPTFGDELREAGAASDRVLDLVAGQCAQAGLVAARGPMSERICTRVGRRLAAGAPLDAAACVEIADEVFPSVSRPTPLGARAFGDLYGDLYDQAWAATGCTSVSVWPPSAINLGLDRRPRLVAAPDSPYPRNWSQGTNRAVHDRYLLHFKASAEGGRPRCDHPDCRTPPPASEAEAEAGLAEVRRASAPYGLNSRAHRVVLRSIAAGLDAEPSVRHGWRRWETWAVPCQAIDVSGDTDEELVDAVASALSAWQGTDVGGVLVGQYGMGELLAPLRWIAIRKAWMDVHRFERSYASPMRRCGIPGIIRAALYNLLPASCRAWFRGDIADPPPDALLEPCPGTTGGSPDAHGDAHGDAWTRAKDRTLALLTAQPLLVRQMIDGDVGWRATYGELASHAPKECLPPADAFELVRELIEGMD